ncbi:MAG TPA: hypothetical protein VEI01_00800 [Terriglobales bacterium]|nr:hypothetical protein [Terriglobales bacterium]
MAGTSTTRLRETVTRAIGPAPWYWKGFPALALPGGERLLWRHHGEQGALGYVVTLGSEQPTEPARLALNTYSRPFLVPPSYLGVWCPEARALRLTCFDPDTLQAFELAEIAGWFKQSPDRIYAKTEPVAEFELPLALEPGTHRIEVPPQLATVDELIAPTSYKAMSQDDPAFALFVLYPHAGLVEVLPQRWFTAAQYRVGPQWITRAIRDPESHRIVGECFGVGSFVLKEDGCRLERWMEKNSA